MLVCYLEVFVTVLMVGDAPVVGVLNSYSVFAVYIRVFFLLFPAVDNIVKCTDQCTTTSGCGFS